MVIVWSPRDVQHWEEGISQTLNLTFQWCLKNISNLSNESAILLWVKISNIICLPVKLFSSLTWVKMCMYEEKVVSGE